MTTAAFPGRPICLAVTLAMLAGCGGAVPRASQATVSFETVRSHDLLYLADSENNVYVYSYPQLAHVQTLKGVKPGGMCADGAGNVFVTVFDAKSILEYAHGGKSPIAHLDDLGNRPTSCSVDPRTGNLAVVNAGDDAGISIYTQARGTPAIYTYHAFGFYYCGYDDAGNLYVDGFGRGLRLLRLPYGSSKFVKITLDRPIHWPGGVRWDGNDLVISDQGINGNYSVLYRFAIQGNSGTTVGSTPLLASLEVPQFFIAGGVLIATDTGRESGNAFRIWEYPQGGTPLKTLSGFFSPAGVTVSQAR